MRWRRSVLALALLGLAPVMAKAQSVERRTVGRDFDYMFDDFVHIWTSPFRTTSEDLAGAGVLAGGFALGLLTDEAVVDWMRAHPDAFPLRVLEPFREHSSLNLAGRTFVLVPLSAALYLAGLAFDDHDVRDAGIGCITSNVATTLSRFTLSALIGRLRPGSGQGAFVIEPFAFGGWDMRSFPGGHAANTIACTSYWNHRFDLGVAEPLLYALSTVVGFARVVDEAHWPSDTFFGLVYGFAVGKGVAARFSRRASARAAANTPQPVVYLGWRITF